MVCSLVSVIGVWRIWKGVVRRRVCLRVMMPCWMRRTGGGGCHGSRELRLLIWPESWIGEAGNGVDRGTRVAAAIAPPAPATGPELPSDGSLRCRTETNIVPISAADHTRSRPPHCRAYFPRVQPGLSRGGGRVCVWWHTACLHRTWAGPIAECYSKYS